MRVKAGLARMMRSTAGNRRGGGIQSARVWNFGPGEWEDSNQGTSSGRNNNNKCDNNTKTTATRPEQQTSGTFVCSLSDGIVVRIKEKDGKEGSRRDRERYS